ncbi:Glyoxylate pathway regulator [Yarrowia sp. B02]|nr:Glyoxylate pathway regulator [Yarrowia sp. B02]
MSHIVDLEHGYSLDRQVSHRSKPHAVEEEHVASSQASNIQGLTGDECSDVKLAKVETSGTNGEYIHIAGVKYHKDDFMSAFGGTLNPGSAPIPSRRFANAAPIGLFSFSITCFILGMCLVNARGVHAPNVMVGCAVFGGGLVEFVAGIWEIVAENTFAATVFLCFSCFWWSWGLLHLPIGIEKYYETSDEFSQAVGLFLMGWFIFAILMTLCTVKATVAFFLLFCSLDMALIFLASGHFLNNPKLIQAGGGFCISTGLLGCYNGFGGVATPQSTFSWIIPRAIMMPGAHKKDY